MTTHQVAAQLVAICRSGFKDEHQHKGWLRKHWETIESLPAELRDSVLIAHMNATHKDFPK